MWVPSLYGHHQGRPHLEVPGVDHRRVLSVLNQETEAVGVAVGGGRVNWGLARNAGMD